MNKELLRDAITVSLMRSAGLDKHKARECADVVAAVLAAIDAPEQESVADLTDDMDDASKLLQHSSPALTAKHYRTKATKLKAVR